MKLAEYITTREQPILLDGSMGTQLAAAGVPMGGQSCLSHPGAVAAIHRHYADIGVDLIITNTLTMNRIFIETHKVGVDVRDVNLTGARLARESIHQGQYVLGDISSTGKLLKPNGHLSESDAYESFKEQAAILAEGGVDGLIIETMTDLKEALSALRACKTTGLPVIVSVSFETVKNGGRTVMGNTARDCAQALAAESPAALGTNCGGITPQEMADIVLNLREVTSLPIIVEPNAGLPRFVAGKTVFEMSPADFASGVIKCIEAGASLVGGCCGTSPAHIQALADLLRSRQR